MNRYQAADPQAANDLIATINPMLYRFFAGMMGDSQDVNDMIQETWLRIHRARHTYRPQEPLLPWVYAIARAVRVDAHRRRKRIHTREIQAETLPEPPSKSRAPELDLKRLLAHLPESQREVLVMTKVTGMSIEDVARATSSTAGAVKQKAHRAYETLRSLLKGQA